MYEYKAKLLKVIDGDTVDLMIDCGFCIFLKQRVRLIGIDAPETRTRNLAEKEKGLEAKDFLNRRLSECKNIVVKTSLGKKGKYGRLLGELFTNDISINKEMVVLGYAKKY
jgi:micrococcal nuclease